jgi:hypothetical protein
VPNTRSFIQLRETFGFDTTTPWALPAFDLLFSTGRAYTPLVEAWNKHYPTTFRALKRLVRDGWVAYQPPVIINTIDNSLANRIAPKSDRYKVTKAGKRFLASLEEDPRILRDYFPRLTPENQEGVVKLLSVFVTEESSAHLGLSAKHAATLAGLNAPRTGRWWVLRLVEKNLLRKIDVKVSDQRAIIPAHYRITPILSKQLTDLAVHYPGLKSLEALTTLRAKRNRFLGDIDSARINSSGATDYDHDIETQIVLSRFLASPRFIPSGRFVLEPRIHLPGSKPHEITYFSKGGSWATYYQPDAEFREADSSNLAWRSILEYERFQNRKDGWAHIERFVAYNALYSYAFEPAILRFVVKSESRLRSYRSLIEAFCDYTLDFPDRLPSNQLILAVSSTPRLLAASDPLAPTNWSRIALPRNTSEPPAAVLHEPKIYSPYEEYFSTQHSQSFTSDLAPLLSAVEIEDDEDLLTSSEVS